MQKKEDAKLIVPIDELVQLELAIARGEPMVRDEKYTQAKFAARAKGLPEPERPSAAEVVYPTVSEQLRAAEFLISWGYQKPEISTAPEVDLSALSDEELEVYERLLAKAQVREAH